eukprot:1159168-Pelagomonas_calceolata.AAC.4
MYAKYKAVHGSGQPYSYFVALPREEERRNATVLRASMAANAEIAAAVRRVEEAQAQVQDAMQGRAKAQQVRSGASVGSHAGAHQVSAGKQDMSASREYTPRLS